ncbi:MAG: T9SS type A sorting domain-containing protein, partial [Bacteroidetes bacterium]|nr:T9SS type A sorting domain-containing protein [Bacteroidota bacterium]
NQCVAVITYNHLELSGSGIKTLYGDIIVNGNLTVANSATTLDVDVANDYGITLAGNFSNSGAFDRRQGAVTINGTGAQSISASAELIFYDLTINKPSGDLTLSREIRIENTLDMTRGDIILGSFDLTIGPSGTISNGDASSYIQAHSVGVVKKEYSAVPAASIIFRIGDNDDYTPVTFTLNAGTLSSASVSINLRDQAHASLEYPAEPHITRYWILTPSGISGSIDYDISCTYTNDDIVGAESNIYPAKYSASAWTYGTTVAASNTLSWSGITSFSEATGASKAPLPVELLQFNARLTGKIVELNWSTASENNNDYFTVRKTTDGIHFEEVTRVPGAGNSNTILYYTATDNYPYTGISYYQLKQTDFDGKYEYSGLVPIDNNVQQEIKIKVYPNPTDKGFVYVVISGLPEGKNVDIAFMDLYGRILFGKPVVTTAGDDEALINLELRAGIYLIRPESQGYEFPVTKLIVKDR